MSLKKIILIGGGGHARSILEAIRSEGRWQVQGIVDSKLKRGSKVLGFPILGGDEVLGALLKKTPRFLIGVGQVKEATTRARLCEHAIALGGEPVTVVASSAVVSPWAELGLGTVVLHGAIVNTGARVGRNCIVNSRALIEHDAQIGDHVHVATGAIVNGDCIVGDRALIGTGAVLREGTHVGRGALVGAGSLVLDDVKAGRVFIQKRKGSGK